MNTEINGETYFELISAGKNKSYRIDAKTPKAQLKPNGKMGFKKNNLSYSYKTFNNSAIAPYSARSNHNTNNLDGIEETTPDTHENDENIGNHYQKSDHVNYYKPKRVKITEKASANIYIKETNDENLNDSNDGKDFEFFDPRKERSPNGMANFLKYMTNTTIVPSYNQNLQSDNRESKQSNLINDKKRLSKFPTKYLSIKKLLEESQIKKRLITEIEDSRLYDYKKSKNTGSFQNLKTANVTNFSNGNYTNNNPQNKSFNDDNILDKSRDFNNTKRILMRYGNNIHTIVRIQAKWRGFNFRCKLYLTLTRYYKGRAFVSHVNVIKRNLFNLFKKFVKIDKLLKPVTNLTRIFNNDKREVMKIIKKHSIIRYQRSHIDEKIISIMKTFKTVLVRIFYSLVVNALRFKFLKEANVKFLRENNSLHFYSIGDEFKLSKESKFQDTQITHDNHHICSKTEGDYLYNDYVQSKLKILRKFVNNKNMIHSRNKLKHLQLWRIIYYSERLNEMSTKNVKEIAKENLKEIQIVKGNEKLHHVKDITLEITKKINEVSILNANIRRKNVVNPKFNKIVLCRVKRDESYFRKIFMRWFKSSYGKNVESKLRILNDLHNSANILAIQQIIGQNVLPNNEKFEISQKVDFSLGSNSNINIPDESYNKNNFQSHNNDRIFEFCESQKIISENNQKKLKSQPKHKFILEVCESHEIQSDSIPERPNMKDPTKNYIIEVCESHEIKSEFLSPKKGNRNYRSAHIIEKSESYEILSKISPKKKEGPLYQVSSSHEIISHIPSQIITNKKFNQNLQKIQASKSLQINSSYDKPNPKEALNKHLISIDASESLSIQSSHKDIKRSFYASSTIDNSFSFDIKSVKPIETSTSNIKTVKKIVRVIKKETKPSMDLQNTSKQDDKIIKSQSNELNPINPAILPKSYIQPQLISQNIINYNISIANDNNTQISPIKNLFMETEIKKGVKLILIERKENAKFLKNKLQKLFSIWKQTVRRMKFKSTKRNYFQSITDNKIEPIITNTKVLSPKREEKTPRKLNTSDSIMNQFKFMIKMTKITTHKSCKLISKHFTRWNKKSNDIKERKLYALNNLITITKHFDKIFSKIIYSKFFSIWKLKNMQISSRDNCLDSSLNEKLSLFIKFRQNLLLRMLNKMNVAHKDKSFKKWKILSSNLKSNLIKTIASTQLVKRLNKLVLKNTLPTMIKNSKLKNLHLKRTHFLKSIIDRITNTIKISIKKKFLNWKRIAIPVEEKKDFVKIINSFTKICQEIGTLINHKLYKNFLKKMKRSAEWKNPISKHRIVKVVTYHLKTGQVCKVERDNYGLNLLWKYMQPLKYYILKLQIKSVKLRETELKANSNKWSIEKK